MREMVFSIAAVERETGISKDTLRVWERRYGFPTPSRDVTGERIYSADEVEKLRLIRSLLDQGHRPGKVVSVDIADLRNLAQQFQEQTAKSHNALAATAELQLFVDLCKTHQPESLRRELSQAQMRKGLFRFVVEVLGPLNELIGAEWASGSIAVFEEHLYTECVQTVLRTAIATIPVGAVAAPRILLTTIPQEQHGLGLLMAEAVFAMEGAACTSLGTQTPIGDIVRAAQAHEADIVALSFSSAVRPAYVIEALSDLRAALPAQVEIWGGGNCSVLYRRPPPFVHVLDLHQLGASLDAWRKARAPRLLLSAKHDGHR